MNRTRTPLLAVTLVARWAAAQGVPVTAIPAAVQQSLLARYPGIHTETWTVESDKNLVAAFGRGGANVRITFTPSGTWVESAIEIGAITLPEAVRTAVVRSYRGYRFADTRRIERAAAPATLFEVHLEKAGEPFTVRFESNGKVFSTKAAAVPVTAGISVAGTWRGSSICRPDQPTCQSEPVLYRITPAATDTAGFDARVTTVVDGREEEIGTLACSLDRRRAALYCVVPQGTWQFQLRHDSLVGGFALPDGTIARRVTIRREP